MKPTFEFKDNTIENNRLIVDFMGIQPKQYGNSYSYSDTPFFHVSEDNVEKVMDAICGYVKYSSSFDWLMPVAAKCVEIADSKMFDEWSAGIQEAAGTFNIRILHEEVVNFIKFYNKNRIEFE